MPQLFLTKSLVAVPMMLSLHCIVAQPGFCRRILTLYTLLLKVSVAFEIKKEFREAGARFGERCFAMFCSILVFGEDVQSERLGNYKL